MSDELPSPEDLDAFLRDTMPLSVTLGMRVESIDPEQVVISIDWAPELCTAGGVLHGGTIMALADTAGAIAAFGNLPQGAVSTSTIESKTNFLGAVKGGTITATSTPLHVGSSTIVVETDVTNEGRRVAKVIQTQSVLRPRPPS